MNMCCTLSFFFNVPATPDIYPLSLHDALPICRRPRHPHVATEHGVARLANALGAHAPREPVVHRSREGGDRKSTRLNSSHVSISYAVFCLKKKNKPLTDIYFDKTHNLIS